MKIAKHSARLLVLLLTFSNALYADVMEQVASLQTQWADVNYGMTGKAQVEAYEALMAKAEEVTQANPQAAEAWIWSGIIKSSFAGAKGGLGALSLVKESKKDLERAMELNPDALDGSAYTSLGTLYFKVPGWPIGFGDEEKAEELLKKALTLNPNGIDPNYFYAEYLKEAGRYPEAQTYLLKAQQAAPRPNRLSADAGRQKEISASLADVEQELKKGK